MNAQEQGVWDFIQTLNRAWTKDGAAERLQDYFHPRMVAITPSDRLRVAGQTACVAGWKQFADPVKMIHWHELDPKVDLFADNKVAVVTYYFDMAFETGGSLVKMGGRDMFVLAQEQEKWWVVADQFSPYPVS